MKVIANCLLISGFKQAGSLAESSFSYKFAIMEMECFWWISLLFKTATILYFPAFSFGLYTLHSSNEATFSK